MKILIETYHSPYTGERVGGAETSLRLLAEEFAQKGHQVIFFSKSYTKTHFGYKKLEVNKVKVVVFTKFSLSILNRIIFKKKLRFFKDRFIRKQLEKVDIVHTYNNLAIIKYYSVLKPDFNYKLVVRMAGLKLFEDFETKPQLIPLYEKYFKNIDLYNFISEGLRDLVLQKSKEFNLNVSFEPYFIKDIGVNLNDLPEKKINSSTTNTTFKIVMASRLSIYQKRQDILIKAMKYLKDYPVLLTIIGDGPSKNSLVHLANSEKVKEQIEFISFKNDIWKDLMHYDLLVHACDYEGLSKIIIESLAVGQPVLCSKVLPLKNYIQHKQNGFLVENNPKLWADSILEIMENYQLLQSVSENAKAYIKENYVSTKNISTYENQFSNLAQCADY